MGAIITYRAAVCGRVQLKSCQSQFKGKRFVPIFCSFNAKMPSISDKIAATSASALISSAGRLVVTSCISFTIFSPRRASSGSCIPVSSQPKGSWLVMQYDEKTNWKCLLLEFDKVVLLDFGFEISARQLPCRVSHLSSWLPFQASMLVVAWNGMLLVPNMLAVSFAERTRKEDSAISQCCFIWSPSFWRRPFCKIPPIIFAFALWHHPIIEKSGSRRHFTMSFWTFDYFVL